MYTKEKRFGNIPESDRFTAERLPILRERLSAAISSLEGWGIRVPDLGRLRAALDVLDRCSAEGRYPDDEAGLQQAAEAILVAQDFAQITAAIPASAVERLAQDLQVAMRGTVEATEPARQPYQYRSQLWFGAAMARGGLNPTVPRLGRKQPDFFVCPYTLQYAVEVKRPTRPARVHEAISGARHQIVEAGHHGIVALDLTDSLDDIGLRQFVDRLEGPPELELREEYRAFVEETIALVWDEAQRRHTPGYSAIMGVAVTVRGWRWGLADLSAPQLFSFFGVQALSSARGNVWGRAASSFFDRLAAGLRSGGVHIHLAEHVTSDPHQKPYYEEWGE